MNNTLIDNSKEAISKTSTLKRCLAIDDIKTERIATVNWEYPV